MRCGFLVAEATVLLYPVAYDERNTPATKADMATLAATKAAVDAAFEELKRYFDVMVEAMRHDFQDAFRDGYQHLRNRQYDLERRIDRLERHASLA